jgi:drug/metabolite transporter (DMT)-like permease
VTVPLSFTFQGVSIPFIQLLMRGDILLIAPLVDIMAGRKVRWYSWISLLLVGAGLAITIHHRGGLALPPLALATVLLYTLGYFLRLFVMTKVAKTGDLGSARRYFVEEKLVALPLAVLLLVVLAIVTGSSQGNALAWGFIQVWKSAELGPLAVLGFLSFVISVFSVLILLDKRENSFCVPLERSASILAGLIASGLLAWFFGLPAPDGSELLGGALLVAAIVLLSVAPRWGRQDVSPAIAIARDADDPTHPAATGSAYR